MRKDVNLLPATVEYQEKLSELITDITVLISQDAERRLELVLNSSILDYQTIPGLDQIHYQSEWEDLQIFQEAQEPQRGDGGNLPASHPQEEDASFPAKRYLYS